MRHTYALDPNKQQGGCSQRSTLTLCPRSGYRRRYTSQLQLQVATMRLKQNNRTSGNALLFVFQNRAGLLVL